MDQRLIVPSNYPSPQPLLDPNGSRALQPLSDAAGNSQILALASAHQYNDTKDFRGGINMPKYIPTVPLQPHNNLRQQRLETSQLGLRRQSIRKHRHDRYTGRRNPIYDSPQYRAYRDRQENTRDTGGENDQKWPEVLEIAFLDALLHIPAMGRRKFSYQGKPHGRNELIKEYLWLAYVYSLPPGERPDPKMRRTRKQVSSHIQVLKGFLKDHPAFHRLFPPKELAKNGFEDSFKNDPCLKALSEGRLPSRRYASFDTGSIQVSMCPSTLWLHITDSPNEDDAISHRYTRLHTQRPRENLEFVPNWRQRFPHLERLYLLNELNCDIIHMDATLELMETHVPNGSFLTAKTEIAIPGRELEGCVWKTTTNLMRPPELYRDSVKDSHGQVHESAAHVLSVNDKEIRIKLPFPPTSWAHVFTSLTELQARYDEQRRNSAYGEDLVTGVRPAREYVEQISMFQEVKSSNGPNQPYVRRGILIWTFHKARHGEQGLTTWRYLNPAPPRSSCMSPSNPSQHYMASMNENFNSFMDTSLPLQSSNMLDTFAQGISTPVANPGLQSPFESFDYSYPPHPPEVPVEHLGFSPDTAMDGQASLVDEAVTLDAYMSNSNVNLGGYDQNAGAWNIPNTEPFDANSTWPNYHVLPSNTAQAGWQPDSGNQWHEASEPKQETWADGAEGRIDWQRLDVAHDMPERDVHEPDTQDNQDWHDSGAEQPEKQHDWSRSVDAGAAEQASENKWTHTHEIVPEHQWDVMDQENGLDHAWSGTSHDTTTTNELPHDEHGMNVRLSPWTDAGSDINNPTRNIHDGTLPDITAGIVDEKDQSWMCSDGEIDYDQLAEKLKQES